MSRLTRAFRMISLGLGITLTGSMVSCNRTPHYHAPENPVIVMDDTAKVDTSYLVEFQQAAARQDSLTRIPLVYANYMEWLVGLNSLCDSSLLEQARGISLAVNNRVDYMHDIDQYDTDEYWAAPIETLRNGYGDCEDYAMAEFDGLQYLHADPNRYRLMLVACKRKVKDVPGDIDHCVLAVDTSAANDWKSCLVFGQGVQGGVFSESGDKPVYFLTTDSIWRIKEVEADSVITAPKTTKNATFPRR